MRDEAVAVQPTAAEIRAARERRAGERRTRITAHSASNWADAEQWDLEFWQRRTPQERLSALVALRNDLVAVRGENAALDWDD